MRVVSLAGIAGPQAEPKKYRSLRVRMGGWSAYFVLLSKEAQAIQLKRAEHGM
jgi:formate C-acetyltransferase